MISERKPSRSSADPNSSTVTTRPGPPAAESPSSTSRNDLIKSTSNLDNSRSMGPLTDKLKEKLKATLGNQEGSGGKGMGAGKGDKGSGVADPRPVPPKEKEKPKP